ncbi:MAG: DJ-1 family glyoxalase III [Pseudomonadota bacterium]
MPPRVLVPLATGCEEMEAVTIIDLLRRAGIEVTVAGLETGPVIASRGVRLLPDTTLDAVAEASFDLIVLPGGAEGARRLGQDPRLAALLTRQIAQGRRVAAICAAPAVLARLGLLNGRRATAYPGFLEPFDVSGLVLDSAASIVMDGPVITSRGPGTAMDFALFLIEQLTDLPTRTQVEDGLQRPASQGDAPITIA